MNVKIAGSLRGIRSRQKLVAVKRHCVSTTLRLQAKQLLSTQRAAHSELNSGLQAFWQQFVLVSPFLFPARALLMLHRSRAIQRKSCAQQQDCFCSVREGMRAGKSCT